MTCEITENVLFFPPPRRKPALALNAMTSSPQTRSHSAGNADICTHQRAAVRHGRARLKNTELSMRCGREKRKKARPQSLSRLQRFAIETRAGRRRIAPVLRNVAWRDLWRRSIDSSMNRAVYNTSANLQRNRLPLTPLASRGCAYSTKKRLSTRRP